MIASKSGEITWKGFGVSRQTPRGITNIARYGAKKEQTAAFAFSGEPV